MTVDEEFYVLLLAALNEDTDTASAGLDDFMMNLARSLAAFSTTASKVNSVVLADALKDCYFRVFIAAYDEDQLTFYAAYASWMRAVETAAGDLVKPILTHPDSPVTQAAVTGILTYLSAVLHSIENDEERDVEKLLLEQVRGGLQRVHQGTSYWLSRGLAYDDEDDLTDLLEERDRLEWAVSAIEYVQFDEPGRLSTIDAPALRRSLIPVDAGLQTLLPKIKKAHISVADRFAPKTFWWRH